MCSLGTGECKSLRLARVCQLLSTGVPIDAVDSEQTGNTALHWAASYANVDVVK
jgi:ankyrin repeat protein